jgi:hypothetical protein
MRPRSKTASVGRSLAFSNFLFVFSGPSITGKNVYDARGSEKALVLIFKYHSLTQRLVHGGPFCLFVCLAGWVAWNGWNNELAGYLGIVAFGWLLLANFLINLMINRFGTRIGPMDFSLNLHPSRTERIATKLILSASGVVGLVVTIIAVQGIKRGGLETVLLVGGATLFLVFAGTYTFLALAMLILSGFRIRPSDGALKSRLSGKI